MFYVLKYIYCLLAKVYAKNADPRVQHLPLVFSPMPVIVILSLYLAFVLHYGPKWMEKRQAFQLKLIMRIYNAVQVLANLTLFICAIPNSYGHKKFSFTCQPVDPTNTEPWMIRLLYITYGYYLTKYLDLFDTIFIVLRKKNQQISFLHIYHHTGMVFGCYIYMTFLPGSHATMLGLINLFVHTVMYSYYFVTSLKPIKETLWWKRHITQLQLAQFGYLFIHFLIVLVRNTCGHPNVVALVGFMQNMFMFALFFEFYYKAYVKKPKATAANNTVTRDNTNQLSKEEKLKSS
ncbi:Elongation of very long chain fatty acids protein 4 [Lucilia cuprina]|nr:Elongation of very long chain fatty acids protein 4 [Lucilia cuprina]